MTIGAASRAARAAGVASGDTGGFSQWLKAKGLDQRGASVRQLLERRYREGVEKGTERSGTGAVLPGKTPAAGREFRFEGYDVRPSGEGWTVPRIDPASVFDTPALARQFIKSWIKGRENPAGRKRAAMKKPGGAAVTFDKTFTSGTLKGMTVPVRIGFSSPAAARAYVSRTASLRGRTGRGTDALSGSSWTRGPVKVTANPTRFAKCVADVAARGGARSPAAVCAAADGQSTGQRSSRVWRWRDGVAPPGRIRAQLPPTTSRWPWPSYAGNGSMRRGGRTKWSRADYNAAVRAFEKLHRPSAKNPTPFEKCEASVAARGGAYSPAGVCAAAGRRKYGKAAFQWMALAGGRAGARQPHGYGRRPQGQSEPPRRQDHPAGGGARQAEGQ